ncbi:unnamed protein product [Eruca vesicaria subsp. sativa]|uniref:Uncharacterized protein n=1 Tax=Eruca vesicaria subsp. sativa TaxID=29727 RepID=A0ABC8K0R1_ERUVS|nr:unnamed protein product [Eruca vesicaria subsp. sativa]
MNLTPIFLAACIFVFLLPNNLSQDSSLTTPRRRPWCPSKKQVFSGSCSEDGGQQCLNDLLSTWVPSVRLSPIYCSCSPKPNNKRLCKCPIMICP